MSEMRQWHFTSWNWEKSGCQLSMYTSCVRNKYRKSPLSVCSKFSQLYFCQILFELVYIWESYYKSKNVTFLKHSVYWFGRDKPETWIVTLTIGKSCRMAEHDAIFGPKILPRDARNRSEIIHHCRVEIYVDAVQQGLTVLIRPWRLTIYTSSVYVYLNKHNR